MTEDVLVSVVIPAYGRAAMLGEAIDSCFESAGSLSLEVVVVDDASPVPLESVAQSHGARYMRMDRNGGSSVARNVGIAHAQGLAIKFLDSDDVLLPGTLQAEAALLLSSGADIVVAGWQDVLLQADSSSTVFARATAPVFDCIKDDLLRGYAVPTGAAIYRRSAIRDVAWDAKLSKLNDWDFFVQAALKASKIATADHTSYSWRQHPGERITTSSSMLANAREFYTILDKLVSHLESNSQLSAPRRRRAAQYLYKELRVLYRYAPDAGRDRLKRIYNLDPSFVPTEEESARLFTWAGKAHMLEAALDVYGVGRRLIDRLAK